MYQMRAAVSLDLGSPSSRNDQYYGREWTKVKVTIEYLLLAQRQEKLL